MKYRKRPVVIDAFRLGVDYMPDWFMDAVTDNRVTLRKNIHAYIETEADIETPKGWRHANGGDFIIRGERGGIYPCKPDIFKMIYEAVE